MRGFPRPRLNADLSLRGSFFEVDCLWDRERLVVELDGYAVHGTRQMFEGDRRRDRILQAEGWRALRVTWLNLRDEPEALAADLRGLLTS
jgi:very-short-patch-repair endonuclease